MIPEPSNFDPKTTKGVPKMELIDNRELVIELKRARTEKDITLPRLLEMLKAQRKEVGMTTLKRVFKEGSEDNDSFKYTTLKPIAEVLLDENNDGTTNDLEIIRLQSELRVKEETITTLNNQVNSLIVQIEHTRTEAAKQMEFLHDQIKLKDKRMDTKDELIQRVMDRNDKKDKAIAELMEENKRLDEDIRNLLEKCQKCDKK